MSEAHQNEPQKEPKAEQLDNQGQQDIEEQAVQTDSEKLLARLAMQSENSSDSRETAERSFDEEEERTFRARQGILCGMKATLRPTVNSFPVLSKDRLLIDKPLKAPRSPIRAIIPVGPKYYMRLTSVFYSPDPSKVPFGEPAHNYPEPRRRYLMTSFELLDSV